MSQRPIEVSFVTALVRSGNTKKQFFSALIIFRNWLSIKRGIAYVMCKKGNLLEPYIQTPNLTLALLKQLLNRTYTNSPQVQQKESVKQSVKQSSP
jgi:hypothetical protein